MPLYGRSLDVREMERVTADLHALPDPFASSLLQSSSARDLVQSFQDKNTPLAAAHRVEQGGIGFSTDRTIGTEHVGNCVGIIVRDPVTARTALAHYDDTSTRRFLAEDWRT